MDADNDDENKEKEEMANSELDEDAKINAEYGLDNYDDGKISWKTECL